MKKKIGTLMENGLIGKAKEAALKENIPFHRLIERAVEKYLNETKSGPTTGGKRPVAAVEENPPGYPVYPGGEKPAAYSGISRNPLAGVTISLEERRKRVLLLSGKYRSGLTDIAGRHDKYAFETYKE
jgi:hypothetical protein